LQGSNLTFYEGEKEVLLMPFVHFIVTKVRKDEAKNTYYINILELPY